MAEMMLPASSGAGRGLARVGEMARRQWWVVVLCAVLAAAGAVVYIKARPITYSATAFVTVAPPGSAQSSTGSSSSSAALSVVPDTPSADVGTASVRAAAAAAAHLPEASLDLSASITDTYPDVEVTATQSTPQAAVAAVNAAATVYARVQKASYVTQANAYNPQISALNTRINTITAGGRSSASAKTELAVAQAQLTTLLDEQYGPSAASGAVAVSGPAKLASVTTNGGKHKVIELAFVAGLLAGIGLALIREQLDDKLRSMAELHAGDTEVIAELPTSPALRRGGTIADDPSGALAEAVRELRTALRFLSVKHEMRTVLVTSASAGDGKSFVAANLAAAWAMSGVRTILVSSDLRRPTVESILGVQSVLDAQTSPRGLSEAIADAALGAREHHNGSGAGTRRSPFVASLTASEEGSWGTDLDELLVETKIDGLSVLPAGISPPNPAELLGSKEMADLLAALRQRAEVIVLDSPPVLAVTDALVLTAHADGVVFVVSQNRTSRNAARRGLRVLDNGLASVLGIVANRSDRSDVAPYRASYGPSHRRQRQASEAPSLAHGSRSDPEARPAAQGDAVAQEDSESSSSATS